MRELPQDITEEMKSRFKEDFDQAIEILYEYLITADYLNTDRIIRCIIYLTKNGIIQFKQNLEAAKNDPRDVMFWAEYENTTSEVPKRVRDFNHPFTENE